MALTHYRAHCNISQVNPGADQPAKHTPRLVLSGPLVPEYTRPHPGRTQGNSQRLKSSLCNPSRAWGGGIWGVGWVAAGDPGYTALKTSFWPLYPLTVFIKVCTPGIKRPPNSSGVSPQAQAFHRLLSYLMVGQAWSGGLATLPFIQPGQCGGPLPGDAGKEISLTVLPSRRLGYVVITVDTLTGRMEKYPRKRAKALSVITTLIECILLHFGLPHSYSLIMVQLLFPISRRD